MRWYFAVFVVSGFASLVDEVVWVRLAMASFGVTTALVSIVLSVFMAGLALGSAAGGRLALRLGEPRRALRAYALAELVIGISAFAVPFGLAEGRTALAFAGDTSWGSSAYYLASAAWIAATLTPFCVAMGATFPFAMAAIRGERGETSSFSHLYLANVIGAAAGTIVSATVLIESLGFRGTILVAGALNVGLAGLAVARSFRASPAALPVVPHVEPRATGPRTATGTAAILGGLFLSGLVSMAMEVVWLRQFAPYLGPEVYTFASVLAVYLVATFLGSHAYRVLERGRSAPAPVTTLWAIAGCLGLAALITTDPRLPIPPLLRVVAGIAPVCAVIGFLTPMLVDRWSGGDPDRAGRAYAVNVVGSIAGPVFAGFVMIPLAGERVALALLATTLLAAGVLGTACVLFGSRRSSPEARRPPLTSRCHGSLVERTMALRPAVLGIAVPLAVVAVAIPSTRAWETAVPGAVVRRDHTATVLAELTPGNPRLIVNGQPTAGRTPITKWMAHLPLAFLDRPPRDALVVCFGMGTTFRALHAWGIDVTAVELVPSVPALFGYFHVDGPALLRSPRGRVVIDDGRRFLERSRALFDVITVDPPPPLEAAGTSLLYSREFYAAVKRRLRPGGVVQQWLPAGETAIIASAARAIGESFPHVRVLPAVGIQPFGVAGLHVLASERPLPPTSGGALAARLPAAAVADLLEWETRRSPAQVFDHLLGWEMPLAGVIALAPWAPVLEDDRPFNEYHVVRRWIRPGGI